MHHILILFILILICDNLHRLCHEYKKQFIARETVPIIVGQDWGVLQFTGNFFFSVHLGPTYLLRVLVYSFTRLLVYSFTRLLVYSFTRLLVYSFTRLLVYSFTRLLVYSFTRLLVYWLYSCNVHE